MSEISKSNTPPPLLFIVGSGRSGTTAYHQYLTRFESLQAFPRLAAAYPSLTSLAGFLRRIPIAPEKLVRPSGEAQRLLDEIGASSSQQVTLGRRLTVADSGDLDESRLLRRADQLRLSDRTAQTVVLKNTLNTARVEALANVFPHAAFHHVVRHPGRVVESLLKVEFFVGMQLWWDGRSVEQYAAEEGLTREAVAARHWARQVNDCLDGLETISQNRQVQVNYLQFASAPLAVATDALKAVRIPTGDGPQGAIEIRPERQVPLNSETKMAVEQECQQVMSRLGMADHV